MASANRKIMTMISKMIRISRQSNFHIPPRDANWHIVCLMFLKNPATNLTNSGRDSVLVRFDLNQDSRNESSYPDYLLLL
jgi:hypothetical protein